MMKYFIVFFLFIAVSDHTFGQSLNRFGWKSCTLDESASALDNLNEWFVQHKSFSMRIRHMVYDGYISAKLVDSDVGYLIKKEGSYRSYLMGIQTIQNDLIKLTIDSAEEIMLISNAERMEYDILQMKLSKEVIKKCKGFSNKKENGKNYYRLEFGDQSAYEYMEFITGDDNRPLGLIYYLREKFPLTASNDDNPDEKIPMVKPRLELIFDQYLLNPKYSADEFNTSGYVVFRDDRYSLKDRFKSYTLKDLRLKP